MRAAAMVCEGSAYVWPTLHMWGGSLPSTRPKIHAWKGLLAGSGVVGFWARSLLRRVIAVGGSGTTDCRGWASCSYRVSGLEHGVAMELRFRLRAGATST